MRQSRTPKIQAAPDVAKRLLCALATLCCLALASGAQAQSLFGCRSLSSAIPPTIEGHDGVFFRVDPDLLNYQRLHQEVVDEIANLSKILKTRGTQLVFVPLPTKALTVPHRLGPQAVRRAYDPILAATLYDDTVQRLRAAGVTTVDGRRALLSRDADAMSYYAADPRLSPTGLDRLARAIADALSMPGTLERQDNTSETQMVVHSPDRLRLQARCLLPLPGVTVSSQHTPSEAGSGANPFRRANAPIAFMGTRLSGAPEFGFARKLSAVLRMEVLHRTDTGENPWSAITSYLLSEDFRLAPPEVLVWEVPIWQNLGTLGRQPFRSLVAAVADECGPVRVTSPGPVDTAVISLEEIRRAGNATLKLIFDAPVELVGATLELRDSGRVEYAVRHSGFSQDVRTYFVPLHPELLADADSVSIETVPALKNPPEAALCRG